MDRIPNNTKVILRNTYTDKEYEVTVIMHAPGYDMARISFPDDSDDYTVRRFSTVYVRTA